MDMGAKPIGPYSPTRKIDNLIFCSGQIGIDGTGVLVAGGIEAETRQAFTNLTQILKNSGCTLNDIVKTTVYLTAMTDFPTMNEIYAQFFSEPYPARATIQVAALPKGAHIEIEATAMGKMG